MIYIENDILLYKVYMLPRTCYRQVIVVHNDNEILVLFEGSTLSLCYLFYIQKDGLKQIVDSPKTGKSLRQT